ncbi:MAG: hypothetical protein RR405_01830 [Clostridia bacterium]
MGSQIKSCRQYVSAIVSKDNMYAPCDVNMRLLQSLPCATWCMVLAISLGVVAKYAEKR